MWSLWCDQKSVWRRNLPFLEGLSTPSWQRSSVRMFGVVWLETSVGEKPSIYRRSVFSFLVETFSMDFWGGAVGIVGKCGECCGGVRRSCGKVRQELRRGAAVVEKCGRSCGKVRRFLWSVLQCCGVRFSPSRFLHPLLAPRWNHLVTVRYGPMAWSSSSGSMHWWSGRLSGWFPGLWL